MSRERILITGSDGFVGRHLVDALKYEYEVVGTMHYGAGPSEASGVSYESMDITDRSAVGRTICRYMPSIIIHLAAKTNGWFSDPDTMLRTNFTGTLNLYESIALEKQRKGYNPKILYVSSSEVYGATSADVPLGEEAPLAPVHDYGVSKARAESASFEYVTDKGLDIVTLRPFTHTGPGQKLGFFVSDMASQIAMLEQSSDKSELFVGDLSATRDYLHVKDVVAAYRSVIKSDIPGGAVLNVCSGRAARVTDILSSLIGLSTKDITIVTDPGRVRPVDTRFFVGDNSKLKIATGWQPSISLEDTLSETLEYWRSKENI